MDAEPGVEGGRSGGLVRHEGRDDCLSRSFSRLVCGLIPEWELGTAYSGTHGTRSMLTFEQRVVRTDDVIPQDSKPIIGFSIISLAISFYFIQPRYKQGPIGGDGQCDVLPLEIAL